MQFTTTKVRLNRRKNINFIALCKYTQNQTRVNHSLVGRRYRGDMLFRGGRDATIAALRSKTLPLYSGSRTERRDFNATDSLT